MDEPLDGSKPGGEQLGSERRIRQCSGGGAYNGKGCLFEFNPIEVRALPVKVGAIDGRGASGKQTAPEGGAQQERLNQAAARGGLGSHLPSARTSEQSDANAVGSIEGPERFRLREPIEERGGFIESKIQWLPTEAGGAGNECSSPEQVLYADGIRADRGNLFYEFDDGHIAGDNRSQRNGFGGFAADLDADGIGGPHVLNLQWGTG